MQCLNIYRERCENVRPISLSPNYNLEVSRGIFHLRAVLNLCLLYQLVSQIYYNTRPEVDTILKYTDLVETQVLEVSGKNSNVLRGWSLGKEEMRSRS